MIVPDIKNIKIAKKYANALFKSAFESSVETEILSDLKLVVETMDNNSELKNFLTVPITEIEDKKEIAKKVFSQYINKITMDFILLLIDNYRYGLIKEILHCYIKEYNESKNIETPVIISAVELEDYQKERITQKIAQKLSKDVKAVYKTDKSIIGGLIIEINDKTIDCSIKTKFENMRKQLIKGNRNGSN